MEYTFKALKYFSTKFVDIIQDKGLLEFQEKRVAKDLRDADKETISEVLQSFNRQMAFLKEELECIRELEIDHFLKFSELKNIMHKHVSKILKQSNYDITEGAISDIITSQLDGKDLPYQALRLIFLVSNGISVSETTIITSGVRHAKPLFQVRIDKKRRLYYTKGKNLILGLDIKRKQNDHSDVLKILDQRYLDFIDKLKH